MSDVTPIFGIPVPSTSPAFLALVRVHIVIGVVSVLSGLAAMLSPKGWGRHATAGLCYFWALAALCGSAAVLTIFRWRDDYHLGLLALAALGSAYVGRRAVMARSRRLRLHLTMMGTSYVFLLTAFYVDNGKNLPLWRALPQWAFWPLPALIGGTLILRARVRHPLTRSSRGR